MALSAINEVLPATENPHLRKTLHMSKAQHENLQHQTRDLLRVRHAPGKKPNAMAKSMNYLKTHTMLAMKPGDGTVADLVVTGCNMGIKSLYKYMNQYPGANSKVKDLCKRLISIEDQLRKELRAYL